MISDIEQRQRDQLNLLLHMRKNAGVRLCACTRVDSGVMEEHIKTYVNTFTVGWEEGRAAVIELEKRALAAG